MTTQKPCLQHRRSGHQQVPSARAINSIGTGAAGLPEHYYGCSGAAASENLRRSGTVNTADGLDPRRFNSATTRAPTRDNYGRLARRERSVTSSHRGRLQLPATEWIDSSVSKRRTNFTAWSARLTTWPDSSTSTAWSSTADYIAQGPTLRRLRLCTRRRPLQQGSSPARTTPTKCEVT